MVIYVDYVFLINFFMDTFILFGTSVIVKKRVNKFITIIGGLTGSMLYCLLMFYPKLKPFYNTFTSMIVISIPILFVFSPKSIKEFLKIFAILNILAFCMGGICTALFYYSNAGNYIGELLTYSFNDFSIKLLLFSCIGAYITIKIIRFTINNKMIKKQHIVELTIYNNDKNIKINALIDTGNTLKEPITNKDAIVVEFSAIKEFLPDEIKLLFYEKNENDILKIYETLEILEDYNFKKNFMLIPFKSVGNENGNLISIKVDKVLIYDNNKKYLIDDVYIAIINFNLTQNDDFKALINPSIFGEERT